MKIDYNPENYRNLNDNWERIKLLKNQVDSAIFSIGIDYTNKIVGQLGNTRFSNISSSISLRMSSIDFHYGLIQSIYNPDKNHITSDWNPIIGEQIAIQQKFIFDSIIFNLLSLFDYFSCLINLIKESNKDKWRKMWGSLVRSTHGDGDFKKTTLGETILDLDKNWVQKLFEYRAELIHYGTDPLTTNSTWKVASGEIDLQVLAPHGLKKVFKFLGSLKHEKDYNLNAIVLWTMETSLCILLELKEPIKEYIEQNRIFSEDQTIIRIKKDNTP